jgi:hypothetical protein
MSPIGRRVGSTQAPARRQREVPGKGQDDPSQECRVDNALGRHKSGCSDCKDRRTDDNLGNCDQMRGQPGSGSAGCAKGK